MDGDKFIAEIYYKREIGFHINDIGWAAHFSRQVNKLACANVRYFYYVSSMPSCWLKRFFSTTPCNCKVDDGSGAG